MLCKGKYHFMGDILFSMLGFLLFLNYMQILFFGQIDIIEVSRPLMFPLTKETSILCHNINVTVHVYTSSVSIKVTFNDNKVLLV